MREKIRWGILGTGRIAAHFVEDVLRLPDAAIVAVGSRSMESAVRFADHYHIPRRHASYAALAADPDIDVIYIATPHSLHAENARLCLGHGKAALVEKPFTLNAAQARAVIQQAHAAGLFLMEAMWTRFIPALMRARALIEAGVIGEPLLLRADFGFNEPLNPTSRLYDLALGGGALLDVGVYPVSLASWVFGPPLHLHSHAHLGRTGVDEQNVLLFTYASGASAVMTSAIRVTTPYDAVIAGTLGRITLHAPFWAAQGLTLALDGREEVTELYPFEGRGYQFEALEVQRCLRESMTESAVMPLAETLHIMHTLDALRAQWGLRYPGE